MKPIRQSPVAVLARCVTVYLLMAIASSSARCFSALAPRVQSRREVGYDTSFRSLAGVRCTARGSAKLLGWCRAETFPWGLAADSGSAIVVSRKSEEGGRVEPTEEEKGGGDGDDGRALDTSTPAGFVGALVLSVAILPYIPISVFSSYKLATTGSGIEAGPGGVFGAAEGIATLTVCGVTVWTLVSVLTRGSGLPRGPFSLLGLTQFLGVFAASCFLGATVLNLGDPEDNPLRGLPLAPTPAQLTASATKAAKTAAKVQAAVTTATAEPRAQLQEALKDAADSAQKSAESAGKQVLDASAAAQKKANEAAAESAEKARKAVQGVRGPKSDTLKPTSSETKPTSTSSEPKPTPLTQDVPVAQSSPPKSIATEPKLPVSSETAKAPKVAAD